jgi:hypothetical protein
MNGRYGLLLVDILSYLYTFIVNTLHITGNHPGRRRTIRLRHFVLPEILLQFETFFTAVNLSDAVFICAPV